MNICVATKAYESWMAKKLGLLGVGVFKGDLNEKHGTIRNDRFSFLRGTFYRWMQRFPELCPQAWQAPVVLSVGDLHAANFGTWRDAEDKLIWGINDFDEAAPLPYTQDLIRLATSVGLAREDAKLKTSLDEACEAILKGYREGLETGGRPWVVESHQWLENAFDASKKPDDKFWEELNAHPEMDEEVPPVVLSALKAALPPDTQGVRILHREKAGVGSLGRPRCTAVGKAQGMDVSREAKALIPSAAFWAGRSPDPERTYYKDVLDRARRRRDPHVFVRDGWLFRALAPDICRIELEDLGPEDDEKRFLRAMGWETANIHLGTPGERNDVIKDLNERSGDWLKENAKTMMEDTAEDRQAWKHC